MNHYFFYKNQSCSSWYNCEIEVWQEHDNTFKEGNRISSFLLLERVKIHVSKHPVKTDGHHRYHSARLDHDMSLDSCHGHHASSVKEFLHYQTDWEFKLNRFKQTDHRNFQRLKQVMLKLYMKYPHINYAEEVFRDAPYSKILIW
jgi:hypothetical protein